MHDLRQDFFDSKAFQYGHKQNIRDLIDFVSRLYLID